VNCLNFGNPEHPEVMWQFSEVVDGMSEACVALGIPVVGGNVSFYNESRGKDIDPTPVVGVIGLVDALTTVPPTPRLADGDAVVALGATAAELGGSEWATLHGLRDGLPPAADLSAGAALHALVRDLVADRVVHGIHDCADGGLAVAVAEMAIASGVGATLTSPADLVPGVAWFSESASRVVLSVAPEREAEVLAAAAGAGVPVTVLGHAGGDRIEAEGAFSVSVAEATTAWRDAIPNILGTLPVPVD